MPLPCGRCRRSTATRASSPARAGSTALPSRPIAERREDLAERRMRRRQRLVDRQPPGERPREHREQVEQDRRRRPSARRRSRRRGRRRPLRPAPPDARIEPASSARTTTPRAHGLRTSAPRRFMPRRPRSPAHDTLVDPLQPRGDVGPGVARRRELHGPAAPIATRRGSSARSATTAVGERTRVVGRHGDGRLGRHHLPVAGDVATRRRAARTRTRGSAPCRSSRRRATARSAPSSARAGRSARPGTGSRECRCRRRDAQPREQEPDRERVGAADLEPRAACARWISGQARSSTCSPFRVSCRPAKVTRVLAAAGRDAVGDEHAVRDDLVVARRATARPSRAPARRRRSAGRSGPRGSPRRASPASCSRGRRRRDGSRRSARSPSRAPRCR